MTGGIPGLAANDPRPRREPGRAPTPRIELKVNIEPSAFPDPLRVGQPVAVTVGAVLESGTSCYSCRVNWSSDAQGVARWTASGESGSLRTSTLEPMAPGRVTLTIDVCPGGRFACERTVITRNVVRR